MASVATELGTEPWRLELHGSAGHSFELLRFLDWDLCGTGEEPKLKLGKRLDIGV